MKSYIINIKGVFKGIYEWGVGFVSTEMQKKWDEFWKYHYSSRWAFWKYVPGDNLGSCGHLMSTMHCIYLHPMNFSAVLVDDGCCSQIGYENGVEMVSHFYTELETLKEACEKCAEFCGAKFELYVSGKEMEVEVPRAEIPIIEKEDLNITRIPYKR